MKLMAGLEAFMLYAAEVTGELKVLTDAESVRVHYPFKESLHYSHTR